MIHKHGSTILLSMGTRPEIIKMAPVYLELKKRGAQPLLLHTGQHSDMATALYNLFGMVPDYHIDLKRDSKPVILNGEAKASDLAELSSSLLLECSKILTMADPSIVLVHGDTSSALMMTPITINAKLPMLRPDYVRLTSITRFRKKRTAHSSVRWRTGILPRPSAPAITCAARE